MMDSLTEQEVHLFGQEFQKELVRLHETNQTQSYWAKMIMPRHKVHEIILHLKGIAPLRPGKEKSWVESRKFKVFNKPSMGLADVLMEPTKEKLSLGENSGQVFPRYLRVVPREDIFDTLLKIHLQHNHSTLRETLHLVRGVISNVPRYLVHKFILLCPVCSNNGATTNSAGLPYTPSRRCAIKARRRRKLVDQFQVDVLDLKCNPDGGYSYILHCMDHITGFHWLFPLTEIDPPEVAQNLVWGIFSLFGFPSELVSDYGKEFANKVIVEVVRLWPDELHIKNYLEGGTYKGDVTRRNTRNVTRFIDDMANKKAAVGDNRRRWSEWLPEIQFMLNATILDVRTGKTPYEKVFRTQPITPVAKIKFPDGKPEAGAEEAAQAAGSGKQQVQQYLTEEIVDHQHTDVVPQGASDGGTMEDSEGVVMVNIDGAAQPINGGSSSAINNAAGMVPQPASSVVDLMPEGVTFNTIETAEGTTYTILPDTVSEDNEYVISDDGQYIASNQNTAEMSDLTSNQHNMVVGMPSDGSTCLTDDHHYTSMRPTQQGYNKLGQLRLEEIEYVDKSVTENWVTLSADGDQLEEAIIKPTIQEVKIAAGRNKGYRIDPVLRKAVYVNKSENSFPRPVNSGVLNSPMISSEDIKPYKAFSPVKSNRVIQLSSYTASSTEIASVGARKTALQVSPKSHDSRGFSNINATTFRPAASMSESGYSTISLKRSLPILPGIAGKRTISSLKIPPAKKSSPGGSVAARPNRFPTTIRTKIVPRPELKIPRNVPAGISRTTMYSNVEAISANCDDEEEKEYQLRIPDPTDGVVSDDDDEDDNGYYYDRGSSFHETKKAVKVLKKAMKRDIVRKQFYNLTDIDELVSRNSS